MGIRDIFKKFSKKNIETLLIERGAGKVQETFEQLDGEIAYDEATKTAIDIIKRHPELADKIIKLIHEDISPTVAVNTVTELSGTQAVHVVENVPLQEEEKITIIENGDFGYNSKIRIAEQLEDEETRGRVYQDLYDEEENRILERLEELYNSCNEQMPELILEQQLKKIMGDIHKLRKNMENIRVEFDPIQEKINRIVARKIAYNYAAIGTTIVSKLRDVMLPSKMKEINMPQLVKEEHENILKERDNINGKEIRPLTEMQIKELTEKIEIESKNTANREEEDVKYNEETAFKEFKENMRRFRNDVKKSLMKKLNHIIQDDKKMQVYEDIEESGLIQRLADLPEEKRKKAIEIFGSVLDGRKVTKVQQQGTAETQIEIDVADNSTISGTPSDGR